MAINTKLSVKQCWDMVNRIQMGRTPDEIRRRCRVAEEWLTANEVITTDEYNELMMAVSYIHRESYHI